MTVLGGFIHKSGLISIGSSSLEIDADVEYYQPTNTHSSNHPVSTGWYHAMYGRDNALGTDATSGTRMTALVGGTCLGMGVDVTINTDLTEHFVYFRINGANNETLSIPTVTTGNFLNNALDLQFNALDGLTLHQNSGGGNLNFKFTTRIKWD